MRNLLLRIKKDIEDMIENEPNFEEIELKIIILEALLFDSPTV